jgi:transposase
VAAHGSVGDRVLDITGDQALLGQVDGRPSAAVATWLASRNEEFRAGIEVVVIDPHAGYAAAVRAALPLPGSRWTTST